MQALWKIKLRNACKCFSHRGNKLGLYRNTFICDCNLNDLKFIFLSKKHVKPTRLCKALIKASIFTRKDIDLIFFNIYRKICSYRRFTTAKKYLQDEGYYIFYDEYKTIKTYDKNKL